jgi:hypothetical protein
MLPAGRYTLGSAKDAYAATSYGASRPGRPGTPIVLAAGESRRLTIRLPRGAVITGNIQNIDGTPAQGVSVRAMRYGFLNGARQLVPAGNSATTDDRGVYRVYGLPAGDYCVAASPRSGQYAGADVQLMTPALVRSALDEMRQGTSSSQARPGLAESSPISNPQETTRVYGYAAVYYPGTTSVAESATITVRQGEERTGIDMAVQLVPTARISGVLSVQDGALPQATIVNLVPAGGTLAATISEGIKFGRAGPDGKFSFAGVPPGRYSIVTRAAPGLPPAAAGTPAASVPVLWGLTDISVDGNDVNDVAIMLQPGYTLAGRLAFDGATAPPSTVAKVRIMLSPDQGPGELTLGSAPAQVGDQGQFTITGITPGRYRLTASLPGSTPDAARWWLRSSVVNGRETLDAPMDIRESSTGAVIRFSDTTTEITGTARDSSGAETTACQVIVAAVDRSYWTVQSRRIVAVRPNSEGRFTVKNLPPGEYFIAAVVDVEQGEWFDSRFLEQFLPGATRITLGDGERKALDVAVVR